MAYASFHCKAYARALMHFEAFITSQRQDVQNHLGFIQKLYIALDEPDGVAGVAASRKQQPSLHEQILDQKSSGRTDDVYLLNDLNLGLVVVCLVRISK